MMIHMIYNMHRSESPAYTVPLLCLQYCILEDVFMYGILIWFVIYSTARFCFLYSTHMLLNKSNVPFIPMWYCNTQNTQQHAQHGILVKVKLKKMNTIMELTLTG